MKTIHEISTSDPSLRGAVTAIGNFDGVHLGHCAVINQARALAEDSGAPLGVMTFEPHPRQLFAPDAPAFRLMNAEARAHRLEKLGVDVLYQIPFTAGLAALSAGDFARQVLHEGLGISHALVGADFRYGQDRGGNAATLRASGNTLGFGVTIAELISLEETEVSSTAIRRALSEGRPADAARMLGHWHRIEGAVRKGDQRGRDLGYPTANISIDGLHPPKFGVYAVTADVLDGPYAGSYLGASSIGTRPMFDGDHPNCETYLFDFAGDLYGARISVGLIAYLRPEMRFETLEGLIAQMNSDCQRARSLLANV